MSVFQSVRHSLGLVLLTASGLMIRIPFGLAVREWIARLGLPLLGADYMMDMIAKNRRPNTLLYNFITRTQDFIVTDQSDVRYVLENSPDLFGVGSGKKQAFSMFMAQNVGISDARTWPHRRALAEYALGTLHDRPTDWIPSVLTQSEWTTFQAIATDLGRIAMLLVFGPEFREDTRLLRALESLMSDANYFLCRRTKPQKYAAYYALQKEYVSRLVPDQNGSIVQRVLQWEQKNRHDDGEVCLAEQIPHFLFPIAGACANTITKTLILLTSSRHWQERCRESKLWCTRTILETLRLWPAARTQIRECLQPVTVGGRNLQKGTQIILLQSVLHRPLQSSSAHRFDPTNLAHPHDSGHPHIRAFNAFGNGSQKCPGRDLATMLATELVYAVLQKWSFVTHNKSFLDLDHLLYDINFTNVQFTCRAL